MIPAAMALAAMAMAWGDRFFLMTRRRYWMRLYCPPIHAWRQTTETFSRAAAPSLSSHVCEARGQRHRNPAGDDTRTTRRSVTLAYFTRLRRCIITHESSAEAIGDVGCASTVERGCLAQPDGGWHTVAAAGMLQQGGRHL
jgi:hypothetical protein